ncbi:SAM-dependent RNA methyltransferase [Dipodascopsis tothii]|uniref:SAM-dependent RNA methyltransferase n=1 Tax=Dipodascopsis tothii TaxID=44089 RepID=UPI0034CD355F
MAPPKFVVEHMEEEISPWVKLEYSAISKDVGAENFVLSSLSEKLEIPAELEGKAEFTSVDVKNLPGVQAALAAEPKRVCLLDPRADKELAPEDGDAFDYFVFGGILGDDPPRDRTGELRAHGFVGRRLGPVQMTTDTAVRVTHMVVVGKQRMEDITYVDHPELRWNAHESTEMPFRYVVDGAGEPIMPAGMRELIRADSERGFEDF